MLATGPIGPIEGDLFGQGMYGVQIPWAERAIMSAGRAAFEDDGRPRDRMMNDGRSGMPDNPFRDG